ncbi:MAG: sugar ABC transporter ATP-binding protein [Sphaerochaetaceae bacterium]
MVDNNISENTVLAIQNVSKLYPGVMAVDNITLDFKKGEIHGLIGKNGAGKTTLVSILSGVISPTSGLLIFKGKAYKSFSRMEAKKFGIDIVTQEPEIIPEATVYESFFQPDYPMKNGCIDWNFMKIKVKEILDKVGINVNVEMRMKDFSISLQQLFAIIKSFYLIKAPLIILDESSASLSEKDRDVLFNIIEKKKSEHSIVYISHRTDEILKICDVLTVLRDGKAVCTESVKNLTEDNISQFIVGSSKTFEETEVLKNTNSTDEVILELEKLGIFKKFSDINLKLHKGEVVGLAGLRGSGRTEIMKAIAGIDPFEEGVMKLEGERKKFYKPSDSINSGIVYLPEEREKEGIIDVFSVKKNLNLVQFDNLKNRFRFLDNKKDSNAAEELIKKFEIKCATSEQAIRYLSGGNKQKAVFGKIYSISPKVFLLDEPTKGIDISTKGILLRMIRKELTQNATILLSAPSLEDLMIACDRIVVLFKGKIFKVIEKKDFDEQKLFLAVQGVK